MTRLRIAALFLAIAVASATVAAEPQTPEAVEKAAITARAAIRTLYARLDVTGWGETRGAKETWSSQRQFWKDSDKQRLDYISGGGKRGGIRFIECRECERAGWGVTATDMPNVVADVFPLEGAGEAKVNQCLDLRPLGYTAGILAFSNGRMDQCVGMANREQLSVREEELDGARCSRLQWVSKVKVRFDVWVCPAKGNNVVRIDATPTPTPGEPAVQISVRSEVVPVAASGLWYPREVVFDQKRGGKTERWEKIAVTEVKINEPIPPETFSLAGMNLAPQTPVKLPRFKDGGYWNPDTKKIDPREPANPPAGNAAPTDPTPITTASGRSTNPWVVGVVAAVAGCAVGLLVVRRRRIT